MHRPPHPPPDETCRNCGVRLLGPYCHECGQVWRGPVRELWSLLTDGWQQITDIDNKILRSLLPLYFRPGWLTERYLIGQRASFIRPLRMYLALSVVLFFAVALSVDVPEVNRGGGPSAIQVQVGDTRIDPISGEAVGQRPDGSPAPARMPDDTLASNSPGGVAEAAGPASTPPAASAAELPEERRARIAKRVREATINFDGQAWDPVTHPLRFEFLSEAGNAWLNRRITIARERVIDYMVDPARFVEAFIATLPTAMFLLLPLFALLLKLMYPFSGRLYIEHLIVALHSHSFLFLGFNGMLLFNAIGEWIPVLAGISRNLILAGLAWMPVYLLLMQKRVYRQGWRMTVFKYGLIGTVYLFMITFALLGALLSSVLV